MMLSPRDYDEAITIFSPEGRLYQVEYALELVKRGAPIAGVSSPEGVVLAANEAPESRLEDPDYYRKLFQLDDHVGAAIAGLSSDARVLVDQARLICQNHRLIYDEPIDLEVLISNIGDLVQAYTQYAGVRPFGVSMIVGGVDRVGCRIFSTDPSGSYRGYRATAVGRRSDEANRVLEEGYRGDLSLGEAIALALRAVRTASEGSPTARELRVAVIPADTRTFRRLSVEEVEKYLK
jgi:proteasome alpha subunit